MASAASASSSSQRCKLALPKSTIPFSVQIHFLPELEPESVPEWLRNRLAHLDYGPLGTCFTGVFQRVLAEAILKASGLRPDQSIRQRRTIEVRPGLCAAGEIL